MASFLSPDAAINFSQYYRSVVILNFAKDQVTHNEIVHHVRWTITRFFA